MVQTKGRLASVIVPACLALCGEVTLPPLASVLGGDTALSLRVPGPPISDHGTLK